jgi:hypothetical protein
MHNKQENQMADSDFLSQLNRFIVTAKNHTYAGNGKEISPSRPSSHDLEYIENDFRYLDSYFGGQNFIGQEIVYHKELPVWGMNYYGVDLRPDLISAAEIGAMIKKSLKEMYKEGRFLGGFEYIDQDLRYLDKSEGPITNFTGLEEIIKNGTLVYRLSYAGGLIE